MISFSALDLITSMALVWYLVAWQALIGASFFVFVVAYGSFAAHKSGTVRHQSAAVTDERLKIMKEIIAGIRVVKMYAWEWNFRDLVAQIRRLYTCLSPLHDITTLLDRRGRAGGLGGLKPSPPTSHFKQQELEFPGLQIWKLSIGGYAPLCFNLHAQLNFPFCSPCQSGSTT